MNSARLPIVPAVRFLAAFFVVAGVAALVVGVHDVLLPGSRLGVLFPGILLVLAGALFLGAVWQLFPIARSRSWSTGKPPACEQPVPVAFLVSILLGVYIFFGALSGAGTQRGIVIGVSLLFMAVGFAGFVLFWDDIEVSLVRVGAGIALTVAGLLVGGWEFWYQNQYVPSHLDRAVSVQVGLKKLRPQAGYDILSATLGYGDIGGRAIVVLGSDYTLTGSVVVVCPRPATPDLEKGHFGRQLPDPQRSRFMSAVLEIHPTVLAAGRFVADGKRLGPNVPASRQMIFYVPHDRYQLLRLRAQVFAISASVPLANQPPVRREIKGDLDVYDLWKLAPSGWFQNLLSGSRGWIVTRYEIVNPQGKGSASGGTTSSPDLRVTAESPSPTWSGRAPSNGQIHGLFNNPLPLDTTETFADTELPLAPVRAPTEKELTKKVPKTCVPRQVAAKRKTAAGP
jgi:hypothetical protein